MTSPCRRLIVPCETQARELDAKLLFACVAAERGFTTILGSKREVNLAAASFPRSIYVTKSLKYRNEKMYGLLARLGHRVVAWDEEAIVYYTPESYLRAKVSGPVLRQVAVLFAWGAENARVWRSCADYDGAPIHVTGNPRGDLLRPELRPFFDEEVQALRQRFGRLLLVNTNFGKLNHYFPRLSDQRQAAEAALAKPPAQPDFDTGVALHRFALFRHFLEMLPALARAFPDHSVVVRPHPSENHQTWREAAAGCPNVHVVHEGNVVPWLLAADAMIHNGCTTGVESYVLGAPAIAYQPVTSERFDLHLPNRLSHPAGDVAELLESVRAVLEGSLVAGPEVAAGRHALIERTVASLTGPLASERIVDEIERFADALDPGDRPAVFERWAGRLGVLVRGLRKQRNALIPRHRSNRQLNRHLFPGTSLSELRQRIGRLEKTCNRFGAVTARERGRNVFEIGPG